jgi:hypothetical protein
MLIKFALAGSTNIDTFRERLSKGVGYNVKPSFELGVVKDDLTFYYPEDDDLPPVMVLKQPLPLDPTKALTMAIYQHCEVYFEIDGQHFMSRLD